MSLELLTSAQMNAVDAQAAVIVCGSYRLMENAGRAVAEAARDALGAGQGGNVAILCGPGNNGGDGFIAARLLRGQGFSVRVGLLGDLAGLQGDSAKAAQIYGGDIGSALTLEFEDSDLVIDALFGSGLSRDLEGAALDLIKRLNAWRARTGKRMLAVDVPSGLDANTGRPRPLCVEADITVTFFRLKPGHLLLPGASLCGTLVCADIGIPKEVLKVIDVKTSANGPALWRSVFPVPQISAHKYERGHAIVLSGAMHATGAARLAARGALRAGAGLVTLASPSDALAVNAAHLTAIMLARCDGAQDLRDILADRRRNAIVLGPGGGVGEDMRACVRAAFSAPVMPAGFETTRAIVLDADALTSFAGSLSDIVPLIKAHKGVCVLTPHEGEFVRLFGSEKSIYQLASKLERARAAAQFTGAIIVLKGADTVVAAPDGRASIGRDLPATLATAGSGDVLAGIITGLLAQAMPAFEAASCAVWLHGAAARSFGPGLIAEDLPEALPGVLRGLIFEAKEGD